MTLPILYHCADTRSFRVLWMLEELELAYRLELLPFPPRVRMPGYLDLNPLGTVPLFVDGGHRMTESVAICHYLATTRGDGRFAVASDDPDYAAYLDALAFGEATLTFPQTLVLRYALFEPDERRQPQVADDYRQWYIARLRGLETMLDGRAHVAGDRFTAADIAVGYALMLADFTRIGDGGSPRIAAYRERIEARPAFGRAKAAQRSERAA